jgi:glutamate dehydrogenase
VELFRARFDPGSRPHAGVPDAVARRIEEAIDAVESLDEDRILRSFLAGRAGDAADQPLPAGPDGAPKPYLSFKLDPARVPAAAGAAPALRDLRLLAPVEGVHLRGGAVARGGLRWSIAARTSGPRSSA